MPYPLAASRRRHRLAAACLVLGPLFMLAADAGRTVAGDEAFWVWSIGLWLAMAFFLGAILAIVHLLAPHADRFGLFFGVTAGLGILTATTMQGLFRARHLLHQAGGGGEEVLQGPLLTLTSVAPGILFPLSLLVLAFGLGRARLLSWPWASALAAGAVLFPLGRFIIGDVRLNVVSDVLFLLALGKLAQRLWSRRGGAEGAAEASAPLRTPAAQ